MSVINRAAFLDEKDTPLRIGEAPSPIAEADEIIVRNHAIAINPVDWHMQDAGIFIEEWPAVLGSDVAGEAYEVGSSVTRFKKGDRVVGQAVTLVTGKARDGAFQLFTVVKEAKATKLPASVTFAAAAALPLALGTAISGLCLTEPGVGVFGIPTPALGLPMPQLDNKPSGRAVIIYGASSSVGLLSIQLAKAGGSKVVAIAADKHFDLLKSAGADELYDRNDSAAPDQIVKSISASKDEFAGVFDTISEPETYAYNLDLLSRLGGGWLATTHPPPAENVPANIKLGMVLGVNDASHAVWESFVTPALEAGILKCLPKQEVAGKGLESLQEALNRSKKGVSATKLVVEL